MNKKIATLLLVLLVCLLTAVSLAQESVTPVYSIEVSPSRLAEPGPVTVTITVSNPTGTDMTTPVTLFDPVAKVIEDFGNKGEAFLKAGESLTWTGSYDVNQATLDNGMFSYYLRYSLFRDGGQAIQQTSQINGKIGVLTEAGYIDVTRTITPTAAKEGEEINIVYTITNSGKSNIVSLSITENKDIYNKKISVKDVIEPGKSAKIALPAVKMGTENLTSGAEISFRGEHDEKAQTYTVENQTIIFGEPAISAKASSDVKGTQVGDEVTLTITLINDGKLDFTDIRITEPVLGDVFSNQTLAAGKELALEKKITVMETADYQFTVTAVDINGIEIQTTTEPITIQAMKPEDILSLTISATADRTVVYTTPGNVRFTMAITNTSNVDAKDVVISQGETKLYTFDTIKAGETRNLSRDTSLSYQGKYRFTATALDPIETSYTFESNDIQIAFEQPTPPKFTPTPQGPATPVPTFQPATEIPITDPSVGTVPKLVQHGLTYVTTVFIILVGLVALLLIIALVIRILRKAKSNKAMDHLSLAKPRKYEEDISENEDNAKKQTKKNAKKNNSENNENVENAENPIEEEVNWHEQLTDEYQNYNEDDDLLAPKDYSYVERNGGNYSNNEPEALEEPEEYYNIQQQDNNEYYAQDYYSGEENHEENYSLNRRRSSNNDLTY